MVSGQVEVLTLLPRVPLPLHAEPRRRRRAAGSDAGSAADDEASDRADDEDEDDVNSEDYDSEESGGWLGLSRGCCMLPANNRTLRTVPLWVKVTHGC